MTDETSVKLGLYVVVVVIAKALQLRLNAGHGAAYLDWFLLRDPLAFKLWRDHWRGEILFFVGAALGLFLLFGVDQ